MEREPHPDQTHLTGIHINLQEQAIEFEDRHGTVGRLVFTGETVLYEGQPLLLTPTGDPGPVTTPPESPAGDPPPPLSQKSIPRDPREAF